MSGLGSRGSITVVRLFGEHDYTSREVLREVLAPIHSHVLVDLSWCGFIDSAVIGVILAKHAELERAGMRLELVIPRRQRATTRAISRLGLEAVINVHVPLPPFP